MFTYTETIRLIRDGEKVVWRWGNGGRLYNLQWRWRKREIIYLSLHCHHQNDSCIKVGSDESHFNVSLIVRDKVTNETVSTNHKFWKRKESRSHTGSQSALALKPVLNRANVCSPKILRTVR